MKLKLIVPTEGDKRRTCRKRLLHTTLRAVSNTICSNRVDEVDCSEVEVDEVDRNSTPRSSASAAKVSCDRLFINCCCNAGINSRTSDKDGPNIIASSYFNTTLTFSIQNRIAVGLKCNTVLQYMSSNYLIQI